MRISFDYDGTVSTARGRAMLSRALRKKENHVVVISARREKKQMVAKLKDLKMKANHIFAVGSNSNKIKKVHGLRIDKHYDNRQDVTSALGPKGVLFKA
jgi:hypothetical protein